MAVARPRVYVPTLESILRRAAQILSVLGYTRSADAVEPGGKIVSPLSRDAVKFSCRGAIERAAQIAAADACQPERAQAIYEAARDALDAHLQREYGVKCEFWNAKVCADSAHAIAEMNNAADENFRTLRTTAYRLAGIDRAFDGFTYEPEGSPRVRPMFTIEVADKICDALLEARLASHAGYALDTDRYNITFTKAGADIKYFGECDVFARTPDFEELYHLSGDEWAWAEAADERRVVLVTSVGLYWVEAAQRVLDKARIRWSATAISKDNVTYYVAARDVARATQLLKAIPEPTEEDYQRLGGRR